LNKLQNFVLTSVFTLIQGKNLITVISFFNKAYYLNKLLEYDVFNHKKNSPHIMSINTQIGLPK